MTDPVQWGLRRDLHGTTLGNDGSLQCDYHDAPTTIATDEPVLFECIRILDPQLDGYRDDEHWRIDAARCSECTVTEIEPPTLGYEEALVRVPLTVSNDVISIAAPDESDVVVHCFSSAAEGTPPDGGRSPAPGGD